ncbi:acetyl-CoA carboxylase, biotin carboxyl carrier protein [Gemmatimonadetes bacterium T265]|nr:acetyl-CoA carboxylase, biotin carboxyl carrier protein [Gemmatimonadetes bacterium T265]
MIDLRYVKKLIEMLDASSVDSIEISSDKGMKLRIAKTPQQRGGALVAAPLPTIPTMLAGGVAVSGAIGAGMPAPAEAAPAAAAALTAVAAPSPPPAAKGVEITSPMVGTFYGAPEPGAPPYVTVGQRVAKGQVVCIIEAMKIMNEIESEHEGVVTAVLAENSHPVEYGQALYRIDPNG